LTLNLIILFLNLWIIVEGTIIVFRKGKPTENH